MADALAQALQAAALNAQLSVMPTFSDNVKEDRLTAKEWLEKVQINRTGGGWTDAQTLTHFRNALRGDMIAWYNGLTLLEDAPITWAYLREKFERDFRASPTVSTVISKLPEIRQKDSENVNHYFSRCLTILSELKLKLNIEEAQINVNLPQACAAFVAGLNDAARVHFLEHTRLMKRAVASHMFNQMAGFHIIAGFKAQIRSELMNREHLLVTLDMIKTEALLIELKVEEKKKISTNGDGSSRILANQVHEIGSQRTSDPNEVDAIKARWKPGNQNNQNQSKPKCPVCHKTGHTIDKCWQKHGRPGTSNGSSQNVNKSNGQNNSSQQNGSKPKKCDLCGPGYHTTDKCFKMENAEKIIRDRKKPRVNKVDKHQDSEEEESCNSKN